MAPRLVHKTSRGKCKILSKTVIMRATTVTPQGTVLHTAKALAAAELDRRKAKVVAQENARRAAIGSQLGPQQARPSVTEDDDDNNDLGVSYEDDFETRNYAAGVLAGRIPLDPSHAGRELSDLQWRLWEGKIPGRARRRKDTRTRRDRTERRVRGFQMQMKAMTDAYMAFVAGSRVKGAWLAQHETNAVQGQRIKVVDSFDSGTVHLDLSGGTLVADALLGIGLVPCSPWSPSLAFTIDTLECFRVNNLYCPRLTIQAYVRSLSELHGTTFLRHLSVQFSIAFDLYLALRCQVAARVRTALCRDTPDWRLTHNCPCCMYKVQDESPLLISMLATYDGNDSLKRVIRRGEAPDGGGGDAGAEGQYALGPINERIDTRKYPNDLILPPKQVDQWAKVKANIPINSEMDDETDNPCVKRWHNMSDALTAISSGVYHETGWFLAVCRHRFTLVGCDMIRSGELSKYPLAVTDKLIQTFDKGLGMGYDVNCSMSSTIAHSRLGPLAREREYRCLVGAFHGAAHHRLCQLSYLATYQLGLGLEDLETCERVFSKSNALAVATRNASAFHRHQAIVTYFEHADDFEAYAALSDFLYNNYKQALEILKTGPANLRAAMLDLNIAEEGVFEEWLREEKVYLEGLKMEPPQETLEMEYLERLKKLAESEMAVDGLANTWCADPATQSSISGSGVTRAVRDKTRSTETQRRHVIERRNKDLDTVQQLEMELSRLGNWTIRWTEDMPVWATTEKMIAKRSYQRALDNLEGLLVARMFELTKANMSGTGYKQRKHIAKALQTRSKAVRKALERYNTAAQNMTPPRETLEWEDVVEHAFLSDFDILRDTREDVRQRPWATNAARLAMTLHYKIMRAREEIVRLDIEVKRLYTHIHDEADYLQAAEARLSSDNSVLAHHITDYQQRRGRFDEYHLKRLQQIVKLEGSSARLEGGVAVKSYAAEVTSGSCSDTEMDQVQDDDGDEEDRSTSDEENDGGDYGIEGTVEHGDYNDAAGLEEEDGEVANELMAVLQISGGDEGEHTRIIIDT